MKRLLLLPSCLSLILAGTALAGRGPCDAGLDPCLLEMSKRLANKGWVGIELDREEDGALAITRVIPDSPAEAAGLRTGDRIVALNGASYTSADRSALKAAYKAMTPENTITYTIDRAGKKLRIDIRLGHLPESLKAQWIAQHLLQGHSPQAHHGGG